MSRRVAVAKSSWKARPQAFGVFPCPEDPRMHDGHVETVYGFVMVLTYDAAKQSDACTILRFIHRGRVHHWRWDRAFKKRYLPTVATRMASMIVGSR